MVALVLLGAFAKAPPQPFARTAVASHHRVLGVVSVTALGRSGGPLRVGDAVWIRFVVTNRAPTPDTLHPWPRFNGGIVLELAQGYSGSARALDQDPSVRIGIQPRDVLGPGQSLEVDVPLADCIRVQDPGNVPIACAFAPGPTGPPPFLDCDTLRTRLELRFARRQFFWERWQTASMLNHLMSSPLALDRMHAVRSANVLAPREAERLYGRAWADPDETLQWQALTEIIRYGFDDAALLRILQRAVLGTKAEVRHQAINLYQDVRAGHTQWLRPAFR